MRISIIGLGYVGCVSSACFSNQQHQVIGVDINEEKVALIQQGKSPIIEPGLADLIKNAVDKKFLSATTDICNAIENTDLSIICVGTPSNSNGSLDLTFVKRVSQQIGDQLRRKIAYHCIVIRSTVLPGTIEEVVIPIIERASNKKAGEGFGIAFNPEFLREGSAIHDFNSPPKTVIGALDAKTSEKLVEIYQFIDAPLNIVSLRVAEAVKYADNAFHALKVVFANEIGALCKAYDIDSHQVMDIFVQDTKLNLSPYYLKPGDAFGGSCLPKDVRALNYALKIQDINAPILESILESNNEQKQRVFRLIEQLGDKKVGVFGLTFKENTDDLRESPTINLVEKLIGKGYDVQIFDPVLNMSKLIGTNKAFIETYLPHIDNLLVDTIDQLVASSEMVVITKKAPSLSELVSKIKKNQKIIDLVRISDEHKEILEGQYYGISW